MINRIKCPKCTNKIKKGFNYCPHCGFILDGNLKKKVNSKDYGLIGLDDSIADIQLGNGNSGSLGDLLGAMMSEFSKQMSDIESLEREENAKKTGKRNQVKGFSISIEASGNGPVKIRSFGDVPRNVKSNNVDVKAIELPKIETKLLSKLKDLSRKEAESIVRRLSDKIIYEINLPGVDSTKKVSINVLGNFVEVKAVSEQEVLFKNINIKNPLKNYKLKDEKLILEFGV